MRMRKYFASGFAKRCRQLAAGLALALATAVVLPAAAASRQPLVSVEWLNGHLHDANLVVLDIRSALDGGGEKAYAAGHIPGSVHSDYDKAGWRVTRNDVPFMVPTAPELEKLIGDLGIDEDSHVVVVPAGVSVLDFGSATRTYWTLKVVGLKNVSILDGGVAAWVKAGLPTDSGVQALSPTIFTAVLDKSIWAEVADVEKIQASGGATLIDARPATFFFGKEKAPNAGAYGHIPGALSLYSEEFYDEKTNRLKPTAELAIIAKRVPAGPAVTYCNTGHWASTDWFVLHELLGRSDARLFAGSMVEWTSNANRPVASSRTKWDDLKKKLGFGS
jgi:thiosulfate/3-mercaptopyruvate sulfurtransferase